ncbi:transcriptional repressor LexA [Patescibacteria group bacterium]|nr:transcriptional repressor LexA [Patescibacteria group bacterium]
MDKQITKKQKEIFDYLIKFLKRKGYAPSYREIATHFDLSSVATVHKHLQGLKEHGLVSFQKGVARSLNVKDKLLEEVRAIEVPLLGTIAAGEPIEAIAENERLSVPEELKGRYDCYALKVRGDSMIEDGIFDGDYVIVERDYYPQNGDVVVALIDNESATLKRYYREKSRVRLQPANSSMNPLYVKNPSIQGKVRAVYRKYL